MSAKITRLKGPVLPPKIFVCTCGCSSFEIYDDQSVCCALCGDPKEDLHGEWDMPGSECVRADDAPGRIRQIGGNGSEEFARAVNLRRASAPDVAAVAVVRRDGTLHMWTEVDTPERRAWLRRQLVAVGEMLPE